MRTWIVFNFSDADEVAGGVTGVKDEAITGIRWFLKVNGSLSDYRFFALPAIG
jgi:hypothetical protein